VSARDVPVPRPQRRDLRSTAIVAGLGLLGSVVVAVCEGVTDGALTAALLTLVGAPALALARAIARRRGRMGSLRRQFAATLAVAVGQLLVAAALFVGLMFVSVHDALLLALLAVFCASVGAVAALGLARGVLDDVSAVRDALNAVADGRRDVRLDASGRDELAELARAANRMVERLDGEEQARRQLVAAVSHDLRTPITSLRLVADGLGDDIIPPAERRAYLDTMGVHLRSLSALIDDLFELSRLEAGELAWSRAQIALPELVAEAVEAMQAHARAKGVAVRCEIADDLQPVSGDPERLQRVLFNLIQNAIRHTPPDGSITVLAEPVDGRVEVEVADTGGGIRSDDRARVFDAFFQGADGAARSGEGAGLGLAISRAIVEAHGGRIWLAGAERGTRVRFSLDPA